MSKFIITLMGYLLSFMLGSIFTVTYIDYKVSELEPTHKEKTIAAAPKEEVKVIAPKNDYYSDFLLEEVTVTPIRDKVLLHTKKSKVENNTSLINNKVTPNKSNLISNPIATLLPSTTERSSIILLPINSIPFSNFNFLNNGCPDAKARSPGTYKSMGVVLDLEITIINSRSNNFTMLKKDKKHLKALLQLLFTGDKYFKIKKDGTVIIKKHWYSRKKVITTIKEIINYIVPRSMVNISKELTENYQLSILEVEQGNLDILIEVAYNHFGNFCTETGYQGRLLNFDLVPTPLQRIYFRTTSLVQEKTNNLKQLNLNIVLARWFPKKVEGKSLTQLKLMPSKTLTSLKEILNTEKNSLLHTVGVCLTGNPVLDATMPKVFRLTEHVDLV